MIYFVRHGQTDWNLISKLQGRVDTELNQTGIDQANATRDKLKDLKFDVVFCSPLKRARQTCEIIIESKCNKLYDERLKERDFGEYEGFKKSEFDYNGFWDSTKNQVFKKAESVFDVEKRVFSFLDEITKKYKNKNILIVAHGGVGLLISSYFKGKPKDGDYLQFLVNTGEVQVFKN